MPPTEPPPAALAAAFTLVWVNPAVGVVGTGATTPLLSKASELAHAAHRRLRHIATSLKTYALPISTGPWRLCHGERR